MTKQKPVTPMIKVNWKLAWYAIVGLIIGAVILFFAYKNFLAPVI